MPLGIMEKGAAFDIVIAKSSIASIDADPA
jgi:hypothetical protein